VRLPVQPLEGGLAHQPNRTAEFPLDAVNLTNRVRPWVVKISPSRGSSRSPNCPRIGETCHHGVDQRLGKEACVGPAQLRGERFEAAKLFVTADDDETVVRLYHRFGRRIKGHLTVGIAEGEHDDARLSGNLRIS